MSKPCRLHKVEPKRSFDDYCNLIAPYLALAFVIILCVILFIVLLKYGGTWFGTEANHYYNTGGI